MQTTRTIQGQQFTFTLDRANDTIRIHLSSAESGSDDVTLYAYDAVSDATANSRNLCPVELTVAMRSGQFADRVEWFAYWLGKAMERDPHCFTERF